MLDDDDTTESVINIDEKALWRATLLQAFLDVASEPEKLKNPKRREEGLVDKRRAEAWFEAGFGVTAMDFKEVCLNAEMEPAHVKFIYTKVKKREIDIPAIVREFRKKEKTNG